jgi:hypothetical protein
MLIERAHHVTFLLNLIGCFSQVPGSTALRRRLKSRIIIAKCAKRHGEAGRFAEQDR